MSVETPAKEDNTKAMGTAVDMPPSYNKAMEDAPPSYSSLYNNLKKTKEKSEGKIDFARNVGALIGAVLCGSVIGLIWIGVGMAIPIAMIVLGAIYRGHCPAEDYIPIYLIVGGSFGVFSFLLNMLRRKKRKIGEDEEGEKEENKSSCLGGFMGLVSCFTLAWFIAGNVWVYKTYGEWSEDPSASNYCHPTLYWFSFWVITASYILFGIFICLLILGACFACLCLN